MQSVCQWKSQDLLLQHQKVQEQQQELGFTKGIERATGKTVSATRRKEMPGITSHCVATCHLTAKWTMSTDDGNRLYRKQACHECSSSTCRGWDLSLASFVNVVLTQIHFRSQGSLCRPMQCAHRDAYACQTLVYAHERLLPAPHRVISSARQEPPFTNRISVGDEDRHPPHTFSMTANPVSGGSQAGKRVPTDLRGPPPTDPFPVFWRNAAQP